MLPTQYDWELYDLSQDYSQAHDLAAEQPERLKQMQELFQKEAERNQVYPLDDRLTVDRLGASLDQLPQRSSYTYWGADLSIPSAIAAPLLNRSFRITADVELPAAPATGVIVALGGKFGGWSFYLKDGQPVALMAASQFEETRSQVSATEPLPEGRVSLTFDFRYAGGTNAGGEMIVSADGREIGRGQISQTISKLPEITDTLDIGFDADTPVTADYGDHGRFPGRIDKVEIEVGKPGEAGAVQ